MMNNEIISVQELPLSPQAGHTYSIESNGISAYTHGFFKYPCKFIPHIPRWAINRYCANKKSKVLDPFCGSGTTLLEAVLLGHNGYGVEIDSFGRMLTLVKTRKVSSDFEAKIDTALRELSKTKKSDQIIIPEISNLSLWFNDQVINDLGKIRHLIDCHKDDKEVYEFLSVCLASIVRKVSNADNLSPKPYVSTRFPKTDLPNSTELFIKTARKYLDAVIEIRTKIKGTSRIIGEDAREFVTKTKFELAVTSPPYINAFDYVRSLRLENLWLGLEDESSLKSIKKRHVGTESVSNYNSMISLPKKLLKKIEEISEKDKRRGIVVKKFFEDMAKNIKTVGDNLTNDGHYVIVVGDSNIKGTSIPTHEILAEIANKYNFELEESFPYVIRNRYLRIPRQGRGGLIKHDWVISLKKGA